jgi:hypothetical protein
MMFLRFAAGERAWHSPGQYANLTIDDPWLREPYGHLNYEALLHEMQQHNFHTTVSFIAWNFDRSEPAVVSLFREHPERLSVCIHGNNHDHQEFGAYERRPFDGQVEDIKQALARMERFTQLTRLPHDAVMVFPHQIAPEGTLALLKRYNFVATANSRNVPMGQTAPADREFALRAVTVSFANFPSLRRYSVEAPIPASQLAIDSFLGNPELFYAHEGFFAAGIGAFNSVADTVNHLQPDTQWRSLGDIAVRLYLEKLRDDGGYDIRAYAPAVHLENVHRRDAMFFVSKDEDFTLPLTVWVDGEPYPFERSGAQVRLQLLIPAAKSRSIRIVYGNDLRLGAINISRSSLRITAIRRLSDFRDNVVSRTPLGHQFIRSYSQSGVAWNLAALCAVLLVIAAADIWFIRRQKRLSKGSGNSRWPASSGNRLPE